MGGVLHKARHSRFHTITFLLLLRHSPLFLVIKPLSSSPFFTTTTSRIPSYQTPLHSLSGRIFLPSVSAGIWNALTDSDSYREAAMAIWRGMLLFRQGDVSGSLVEFDKGTESFTAASQNERDACRHGMYVKCRVEQPPLQQKRITMSTSRSLVD